MSHQEDIASSRSFPQAIPRVAIAYPTTKVARTLAGDLSVNLRFSRKVGPDILLNTEAVESHNSAANESLVAGR